MFAGEDEETGHGLSDYELERIAHIRRNREIMRRLGLGMHDIVTAARQRCGHDVDAEDDTSKSEKKKMKKATGAKRRAPEGPAGEKLEEGIERVLRRSRRLQEKPADADVDSLPADAEEWRVGRGAYSVVVDGAHEAEAEAYRLRNAGVQERVSVVGTASYQHTLMRVRTMDEAGLARRIKAIERAKGKHAVVKMRLFARVLFLEGYEALADDAAESLERLVEELGDPDADDAREEGKRETTARDEGVVEAAAA